MNGLKGSLAIAASAAMLVSGCALLEGKGGETPQEPILTDGQFAVLVKGERKAVEAFEAIAQKALDGCHRRVPQRSAEAMRSEEPRFDSQVVYQCPKPVEGRVPPEAYVLFARAYAEAASVGGIEVRFTPSTVALTSCIANTCGTGTYWLWKPGYVCRVFC